MQNRYTLKVGTALAGLAVLVTACNKSSTSPNTKTETVTATASIPANPTAPVTISTTGSQSNASVTVDAAGLQGIAALVGGPVTVTMSDLAPKDYGQIGAAAQTSLSSATGVNGVLSFSFSKASGNLAADRAPADLVQGLPVWNFSYKVVNDACPTSSTVTLVAYVHTLGWVAVPNTTTFTKANGTITGQANIPQFFFDALSGFFRVTLAFKCPNSTLTGGIG
jgi:hypothetical protein